MRLTLCEASNHETRPGYNTKSHKCPLTSQAMNVVELQIVILTSFAQPPALFMAPNMLWKLNWLRRTVTLTKYEINVWCVNNIKSISSTNLSKCEENHSNETTIPGLPPSIKLTGTHLYTWVERGTVRVMSCPITQHTVPGLGSNPDHSL